MMMMLSVTVMLSLIAMARIGGGVELSFELPDNAKQCFYEEIKEKGVKCTVEFQVITGGHYDVDMTLEAPNGQILYKDVKKQYDNFEWTTDQAGVYTVCFSNEFSTFSHKLVYMDFRVGEEKSLPNMSSEHATVMTLMESTSIQIHENLNSVVDYQTHHRLQEAQDRKRAEDLNERVFYWSVGEAIGILVIVFVQVMVLKNFFAERKPSQMNAHM